jgi:SAM-dependent methyltransferase
LRAASAAPTILPMGRPRATELEERDQQLREAPYSSTFTYARKKIAELVNEHLQRLAQGARILDVGCSTGYHVHRLRERGFEVVGVEPVDEIRALARESNPGVEIVAGVIERLPFPDASFDVALAVDVLPRLRDPVPAVAELARVLQRGGIAIANATPRFALSREPSLSSLSSAQARALFERAGFADVDVHGIFLGRWQGIGRLSGTVLEKCLRVYEPLDDWLSDRPLVRDLANHLVVVARR